MKRFACLVMMIFALLFAACKSKPAVPEAEAAPSIPQSPSLPPSATLAFTDIHADDIEHLRVSGILEAKAPSGSRAKIESWQVLIDESDASFAFSLNYPHGEFSPGSPVPLTLNMDIAALAAKGLAPTDEYAITLITELDVFSDSALPSKITLRETADFPGLREPRFNITSIAILKAELINTRFRVTMRIDNPNPFPLELSGLVYKLYGNGRPWADGTDRSTFTIAGKSSVQGQLYLTMNFINMDRNLLNQIINLVDVNYRFTGEAQISTGIDYLPKFKTDFDLSGYSEVLDK